MPDSAFQHVAIVGVGLLGGSLGMAMRKRGLAKHIVGVARRESTRSTAVKRGCVDKATDDLRDACHGADLIVIATPVEAALALLPWVAELPGNALITDVGSTKASIVQAANDIEAIAPRFVGSHPMAGSDATGPSAAAADLFEHKPVVLTPGSHVADASVDAIDSLWRDVGMRVVRMSPVQHDQAAARISHLPHALSVLLMNHVGDDEAAMSIASTGLADITRLAGGDVTMWADILLDNSSAVIQSVEEFRDDLEDFCDALVKSDREKIEAVLMMAQKRRQAWRGPRGKSQ